MSGTANRLSPLPNDGRQPILKRRDHSLEPTMALLSRCAVYFAIAALTVTLAPGAADAQRDGVCPDGYQALRDGDPETAAGSFQTCLSQRLYDWPVEAELRARLGAAQLASGDADAALLTYNQVFALVDGNGGDIDNPTMRRNRAAAYLQLDRHEEALADIDRALIVAPDDPFARLLAGSAYLDLDRHEEAVAAFDAALRTDPGYVSAWIGRSAAFVELGLDEQAVSDGREAVSIAPDDAGALNALCWALVKAGRAADGLTICDAAVEADPESGPIVHSRAAALEQLGRHAEAAELYARAHELAPDDPEITADYERIHGR
jgi:tetratricopeptide (TPR) repeat protein